MLNDDSQPSAGVLYVDDEEKALKYFRMAFSPKFQIFTASSGAEGLEVLRREAGRIAIVISDQRMPEMLGAEFLGLVREGFPEVVRILTTAYSDLESAIQAVNRGHIYQYVVKPWEVQEFGMVLQRAADYHHVLAERNQLLALKMTTLQRILCSDRVKWLLIHSRTLSERKQSAFRRTLVAFVKAMPEALNPVASAGAGFQQRNFEIGGLIRDEYLNATRCLDLMNSWTAASAVQPLPDSLAAQLNDQASVDRGEVWSVPESLRNLLSALLEAGRLAPDEISLEIDASCQVRLTLAPAGENFDEGGLIRTLFGLLIERETPELSVLFFETLLAISVAGGSLTLGLPSTSLNFAPVGESDAVDAIITELYEKFSASDISRL